MPGLSGRHSYRYTCVSCASCAHLSLLPVSIAGACQSDHVTESMVKEAARLAGASSAHLRGMRYFAIDGCWLGRQRRPGEHVGGYPEIMVDDASFPHGIGALAKFVQDEGLIFGLGVTVSSARCTELEPPPVG